MLDNEKAEDDMLDEMPDQDEPMPGDVREHIYEGNRCIFCNVDMHDADMYEIGCVWRQPFVHTSQSPAFGGSLAVTTDQKGPFS